MSNQRRVLITGAAGGIGSTTARVFAKNGYDVILTDIALQKDVLDDLARRLMDEWDVTCLPLVMDVTDVDSISRAVDVLVTELGVTSLNVLVNNAGKSMLSLIDEMDLNQASEIIDIMLKGPVYTTVKFLPLLRQGLPNSSIITVSSLAALITPPFLGIYAAAKLGMDKIIETWRYELEPQGFHLGIIHVGATSTGIVRKGYLSPTIEKLFQLHDKRTSDLQNDNPRTKILYRQAEEIVKFFERDNQVPPSRVAETIYDMVQKKKPQSLVSREDAVILKTHPILGRLAKREFSRLARIASEFPKNNLHH